jgi:hypothetical protein
LIGLPLAKGPRAWKPAAVAPSSRGLSKKFKRKYAAGLLAVSSQLLDRIWSC